MPALRYLLRHLHKVARRLFSPATKVNRTVVLCLKTENVDSEP